jgi:RNA polymerase sigma-70 factor, ECF subfamily
MSEANAIKQLKSGEIAGLDVLISIYYVQAVRAAYLVLHDTVQAEDVAQASFLRAYERIAQFDTNRPFGPWFLRGVVNDARMHARKHARTVPFGSNGADDRDVFSSSEPSPEELLIAAETNEAIWQVLEQLTVEQRAVIVRRYYLGLSEAEIASDLECPPGTVKSRLHTARQRLRKLLPAWLIPATKDEQ